MMLCSVLVINAQTSATGYQVHAGLGFPTGKFASDNDKYDPDEGHGHAAMGINLGGKYYQPIKSLDRLSWLVGLELFYNGLQSDYKDDIEDGSSGDFTFPKYVNLSPTAGLNYQLPMTSSFSLYGEIGVGLNYSAITNYSKEGGSYDFTTSFKSQVGLAYGLEAGALINNNITVSLRYNGLGSYKYKYTDKYNDDESDGKFEKSLPIELVSLAVGYRF